MSEAYRPPSLHRRVAVWLVGFVVTGQVFHGVDRRDVGRLTVEEFAIHATSMCIVLGAVGYLWFVIPRELVSTVMAAGIGVAVVLGGIPMLTQWVVTKALEIRQLL